MDVGGIVKRRPIADRFWEKVDKRGSDDCWEWKGVQNGVGYGMIGRGGRSEGKMLAHRLSWELHNGPIPKGQFVCHQCDNPGCMNPAHLFIGSAADNSHDMVIKGRQIRGAAIEGAKLIEQDVREILCFLAAEYSQSEIARGYGVIQQTISLINTGKIWVWVERPAWI